MTSAMDLEESMEYSVNKQIVSREKEGKEKGRKQRGFCPEQPLVFISATTF